MNIGAERQNFGRTEGEIDGSTEDKMNKLLIKKVHFLRMRMYEKPTVNK